MYLNELSSLWPSGLIVKEKERCGPVPSVGPHCPDSVTSSVPIQTRRAKLACGAPKRTHGGQGLLVAVRGASGRTGQSLKYGRQALSISATSGFIRNSTVTGTFMPALKSPASKSSSISSGFPSLSVIAPASFFAASA